MQMGADELQKLKGKRRGEIQMRDDVVDIFSRDRTGRQIRHVILATRFASRPASQIFFC